MAKVDMKQNDRLPVLEITIKKTDGTPLDLTGATAKFFMVDAKTNVTKVSAAATVKNATGGVVEYAWAAGDTDTAGDFKAEVEITYADGKKITAPSEGYIEIKIHPELG